MSILAAYTPSAIGQHVIDAGLDEAERRDTTLVVVNAAPRDNVADRHVGLPGRPLPRVDLDGWDRPGVTKSAGDPPQP